MAEARSAEEVMEREMKRFQERYKRAQKQADEAKVQVEKLERALAMLREQRQAHLVAAPVAGTAKSSRGPRALG